MNEPAMEQALEVERTSIGTTRVLETAPAVLNDGQIRVRVDRFAVTANNITYAVFGDMLGYWEFFPAEPPFGRVPAMGWAEVIESRHSEIAVGGRYYGWYPMASEVVFTASKTSDGFRDDGEHRASHAPVYRAYVDTSRDAMYDAADDGEDRHVLLRGLFLTGFLAEEFFADSAGTIQDGAPTYFGASQVLVVSASSKTAIGFAQRAAQRPGVAVVGLTSARNADFVRSLGYYDDVVTYDDLDGIADDVPTVSIDMAGNPTVLGEIHARLGERLKYSMTVGRSHHDAPPPEVDGELPGPAPQLFFAPTEVGRRQEEWGRETYGQRCAAALSDFVEGSRSWMSIDHRLGVAGATSGWADVHDGNVGPDVGVVVLPNH